MVGDPNLREMSTLSHQIDLVVNTQAISVPDDGASLLEVLRDRLGLSSVKDGCSPQGQCGCCTVLVDGQPRVSCVTPARRVKGRTVTTLEGLEDAASWADAFCATGASQCGFCTPGIIMRMAGLRQKLGALTDAAVRGGLKAHLCRCTGWQTIVEAAVAMPTPDPTRTMARASARATLEGGGPQVVGPEVALGNAGFADDSAPADALVAIRSADGQWVTAETVSQARLLAGKVQGRRTTFPAHPPIVLPEGSYDITLRTSWVEPAYLETDASWCEPGGDPVTALANGGAFGAKLATEAETVARMLANEHMRPVRVLYSREDTVQLGPKRPPMAAGVRGDGTGVVVVARTPGIADAINSAAPGFEVHEVDVPGPPTSAAIRAAGWAEAAVLINALQGGPVTAPNGSVASATYDGTTISLEVSCGDPLDEVVLRSYCMGAAHMAYSWVTSEALAVDDLGQVMDLSVRSFGVVRAVDMPHMVVTVDPSVAPPVNGSDAVFAAVAAAVWRWLGHPPEWPAG